MRLNINLLKLLSEGILLQLLHKIWMNIKITVVNSVTQIIIEGKWRFATDSHLSNIHQQVRDRGHGADVWLACLSW